MASDVLRTLLAVVWAAGFAIATGLMGPVSAWYAALFIAVAVGGWFAILGVPHGE